MYDDIPTAAQLKADKSKAYDAQAHAVIKGVVRDLTRYTTATVHTDEKGTMDAVKRILTEKGYICGTISVGRSSYQEQTMGGYFMTVRLPD